MTDRDLLMFGCAVTAIALGGAYVYFRTRFMESMPRRALERSRDRRAQRARARARAAD